MKLHIGYKQRRGMVVRRGFTLIELLVVIAIISILAVLIITRLAGTSVRAKNANAKSDITQIGKGIGVEVANNPKMADKYFASTFTNPTITGAGGVDCTNGTCLDGTATPGSNFWNNYFNDPSSTSKGYNKLNVSKTPTSDYVYGYSTDAAVGGAGLPQENDGVPAPTATNYCIATNVSTASGVTDSAFFINNGNSGSSTAGSAQPVYAAGTCN